MKSSACEPIRNGYFNLERLSRSSRLAWPGISTLERLWFRRRSFYVPNLMHKLLFGIYFENHWQYWLVSGTVLGTAVKRLTKFDVWINRRTFVNLGRLMKSTVSELCLHAEGLKTKRHAILITRHWLLELHAAWNCSESRKIHKAKV